MTAQANFSEYLALVAKVDEKFAQILARHPAQFSCRAGCHSCCQPGLTISIAEFQHIALFLQDNPLIAGSMSAQDAHAGSRCRWLDGQGHCTIYPVRPIICRSHCAPIKFQQNTQLRRDVCSLNFTNLSLAAIDALDFVDIDTLNTILSLINRRFDPDRHAERFALERAVIAPLKPS